MLTVRQRDLLALYCLHMGIRSPQNVKRHLEEYEEIYKTVNKIAEEMCNVQKEEERSEVIVG